MAHIPVLRDESIDGIFIKKGETIIDGTLGGGGHTLEIVRRFGKEKGEGILVVQCSKPKVMDGKVILNLDKGW